MFTINAIIESSQDTNICLYTYDMCEMVRKQYGSAIKHSKNNNKKIFQLYRNLGITSIINSMFIICSLFAFVFWLFAFPLVCEPSERARKIESKAMGIA